MHCDGCHDINWLHERPSLARLRGQLVSPIRILEAALLWIQSFTGFTLTDHDDWHIDDREHCLQGRSIVRINVSSDATAPGERMAILKVVLTDRGDWHIDDREHCLQGRSIVMIAISVNVRNIGRQCEYILIYSVLPMQMVLELDYFSTLTIVLDFSIHCSTVPYWAGASPGLGRLESLRPAKVCVNRSTHVRY